jgi:TRAP transporter TAXI family solute receptor
MRFTTLRVVALFLSLLGYTASFAPAQSAPAQSASAQETGIKIKKPVFGGACKICPWGAIAEIVKAALQPYGYDVQICYNCATAEAPRIVAAARVPEPVEKLWQQFPAIPPSQTPPPPHGPVEFGATSVQNLWWAYSGTHTYAGERPRSNLRLLAVIQSPNYLIVAVKADLGIGDLGQVKQKRWPVRILTDGSEAASAVLAHYGLTKEAVESAGGHIGRGVFPEERKNFDVIVHGGTLGNAPEFNVWYEVSQKYDLRYLELPHDLLVRVASVTDMEPRSIPNGLLRGIDHPIPTVARTGHAIYGRADMPDDFAYTVAKAIDEQQYLLQWAHLNFSYNRHTVWKAFEVPLHPGAARYYRETGYMK